MTQDSVDQLYRDRIILDHCRNPRNQKKIEHPDIVGNAVNPFCGDEIHIQINLGSDSSISAISFQGEGCAINVASGSLLSEYVKDMTLLQVNDVLVRFIGLMRNKDPIGKECRDSMGDLFALYQVKKFPVRIKCALLAWSALDDGLNDSIC